MSLGSRLPCEHHPPALLHEVVQGVGEFRLDLLLAAQKLDLLQDQHVAAAPEFVFELLHPLVLERVDHLVGEIFRGQVVYPAVPFVFQNVLSQGVGEMAFAQARFRGQIKAGCVQILVGGQGHRGGVCQLVGRTHHEPVERVSRIEA